MKKVGQCAVCKKEFKSKTLTSGDFPTEGVTKLILQDHPEWTSQSLICFEDLNRYRSLYVRSAIKDDLGEISALEEEVLRSIKEHELVVDNLNTEFDERLSYGDLFADKIALFGGSWKFILTFLGTLIFWVILNVVFLNKNSFDPYPFILLNLILSCLAAIQAPVILMSQNRQARRDRFQAELDYKVNLKSELEIRHIKSKIDQLASHQWRRLLEIQELQTTLMTDLTRLYGKTAGHEKE